MNVFNRIETKYIVTHNQYLLIKKLIYENGFYLDKYGRSTIQTLYYDTLNNTLIRRSLEKPIFKEKIRVRNYGLKLNDKLYLEIKRKYRGIVYKRRLETNINDIINFFNNKYNFNSQIGKEVNSFRNKYKKLIPTMMIITEREAYYSDNSDIRFTFDFNIRSRNEKFSFNESSYGNELLKDNEVLLEIKSLNNYPLWLVRFLNEKKIFKTSFSKYGNAYIKEF